MASTSAYVVIHCKLRCVEDGDEPCLCEPKVVGVFLALDNANEEARREFDVNVLIAAGMIGEDAKDFAEYGDDGTVKYSAPDLSEGAVVYVEEHPLTDAYDEDEEDDDQQEGAPADAHAAYPPPEDEEDDDFADEERDPLAATTVTHMADDTGGTVSAPGDPDTESDDGGALDLLDLPLPTLFARGAAIHRAAQEGTISQAHLADGVATLRRATEAVRQLGLFSRNEEADDVATGELKYLLLPLLLAQVLVNLQAEDRISLLTGASSLQQTCSRDAPTDLCRVTEGQQCLEHFLLQCESYGLVPANARAVRERVEPVDPGTARAEKIARFKRDKEITAKLDAIEQRMASRRGRSARDSDEAAQAAQADDDEEDERAAWLLRIQSAVYKAIDLQPLLATEAALLASRPVLTPQMSAAAQAAGGEPRPTAPSMVVIDALSRVTMTSERERMRGEVFRPSHILPTMTIEQFGELEYQRMVEAEASRQKAETAARDAAAGSRSDDEAEEDAKLAKARSWDDWKDDHKFGSGNSRLRPCGR